MGARARVCWERRGSVSEKLRLRSQCDSWGKPITVGLCDGDRGREQSRAYWYHGQRRSVAAQKREPESGRGRGGSCSSARTTRRSYICSRNWAADAQPQLAPMSYSWTSALEWRHVSVTTRPGLARQPPPSVHLAPGTGQPIAHHQPRQTCMHTHTHTHIHNTYTYTCLGTIVIFRWP